MIVIVDGTNIMKVLKILEQTRLVREVGGVIFEGDGDTPTASSARTQLRKRLQQVKNTICT